MLLFNKNKTWKSTKYLLWIILSCDSQKPIKKHKYLTPLSDDEDGELYFLDRHTVYTSDSY